jgi:hypothetical protein
MIDMVKQSAIRIGRDATTGKVCLTRSDVHIPSAKDAGPGRAEPDYQDQKPLRTCAQDMRLGLQCRPIADGAIRNGRAAGGMFRFESETSPHICMTLDDQQLRALAIDVVKASMMRGIEF